jgi:hypothetical protein
MAFGVDKPISSFPARLSWINVHHVKIQTDKDFDTREGAPKMPALGVIDHREDIPSDISTVTFKR